jgi:hypothetical protein
MAKDLVTLTLGRCHLRIALSASPGHFRHDLLLPLHLWINLQTRREPLSLEQHSSYLVRRHILVAFLILVIETHPILFGNRRILILFGLRRTRSIPETQVSSRGARLL